MVDLIERYQGCLLGLACGDALGGPVEFIYREKIRENHPDGLRDFVGGGWLDLFPGEITDDTQMALAIAESLAIGGPLDMHDLSTRFVAWLQSQPKDIGNTTRAAIRNLEKGHSWETAGELVSSMAAGRAAGNGSVMRCAPVALRFRHSPTELVRASVDTSRVTHADPRCTSAAVAVNQAIVHLLGGGDPTKAVEAAIVEIDSSETRHAIERAARLAEPEVPDSGYVLDTVTASFWAFANHDSLEEAIIAAVALGGDADTTGALTGALAGAHYGINELPIRWLNLLQHRERLTSLANQLYVLSQDETPV